MVMTTGTATTGRESRATTAGAWRAALAVNAVVAAVALVIKFAGAATTADPAFPTVFGRGQRRSRAARFAHGRLARSGR